SLRTLTEEFPDAVGSWGGPTVLRNPDTVREVAQELGVSARPAGPAAGAAPTPPVAAAAPEVGGAERGALAEQLGQVARCHAEAARFAEPRPVPFWLALLLGVALVGVPFGAGTGALYFHYYSPYYSQGHYLDYRGQALDAAAYAWLERRTPVEAVGLGAV